MGPELDASSKPPCHRQDALAVVRRLRDAGHVAYFAGGCVRDLLLGKTPKDYDVATDAPPQRVRELFSNTQAVGQAFGVILVKHGRSTIEIATFRSDGAYLDGRRPDSVRFTTAQEDAKRRDFTINGLFLDPIDDKVIDFVGGQQDLAAGVIRAIGDAAARFGEDHLRLLRAVRFASRFGFQIEPATAQAIRRHAPELVRISPERIGEELRLMLTAPTRAAAWRLLGELELKPVIFRFIAANAGLPAPPPAQANPLAAASRLAPRANPPDAEARSSEGAQRAIAQGAGPADAPPGILQRILPQEPIPFGVALAAAVIEHQWPAVGNPLPDIRPLLDRAAVQKSVQAMRKSLKISNDVSDQMAQTLEGLAPLLRDEPPTVATVKRFLARPTAPLSVALLDALRDVGVDPAKAEYLSSRMARWHGTDVAPSPLVNGDDLTAAGFAPGPAFRRVLESIYDAQLEDRVTDRAAAMELARKLMG